MKYPAQIVSFVMFMVLVLALVIWLGQIDFTNTRGIRDCSATGQSKMMSSLDGSTFCRHINVYLIQKLMWS